MKIVCDNCSAKYSIADEKVAGKVFKIRCKKCTNVIVVRGDQLDAPQEEATQVYDYGGEAVWHVVVDGDQQGPFAPAQIGAMLTDGTIDWEAYVWKEGFDGWKPARDIPDLVAAITGDASQAEAAPAAAAAAAAPAAAAAAAPSGDAMGADPFAAASDAFAGEPAAAQQDAGADLFAAADPAASPFGGVDDDVVASAPSPRVSEEQASMTGQRNENSVLFSLSNLQALATGGGGDGGGGGGAPAPSPAIGGGGGAPPPGHASGEGSGLIDIRALASATASTGGPAAAPAASSGGADDLLSIGGGGGLGSSLGAPVLAPAAAEPEKNNKGMIIGLAAGGVLVVGLLIALVVVLTQKPEPVATANAPNTAGQPVAGGSTATPAVDTTATDMMPAGGTPVTSAMTEETPPPTTEMASENSGSSGSSGMRRRPRTGSSPMTSSTPMTTSTPMTSSMMASGSIDDLLNQALGMSGMSSGMMSAAMMSSNLPQQPSRDDVGRALRGISSRVGSCGNGTSGVANAAITFANSGRVRSVRVTGVPPAVQSCVARTVRSARVSPFQRATFNVNFPFRVR